MEDWKYATFHVRVDTVSPQSMLVVQPFYPSLEHDPRARRELDALCSRAVEKQLAAHDMSGASWSVVRRYDVDDLDELDP